MVRGARGGRLCRFVKALQALDALCHHLQGGRLLVGKLDRHRCDCIQRANAVGDAGFRGSVLAAQMEWNDGFHESASASDMMLNRAEFYRLVLKQPATLLSESGNCRQGRDRISGNRAEEKS
jgi:hypothetical protein